MKKVVTSKEKQRFYSAVTRAIKKSARRAREIARMYGTPVYVWENGRVVAKEP